MPWTIKDVESKKKGLTDKQKKHWVEVANSVRKNCLADGGTEKECDAKAIKQANGVVGNSSMQIVNSTVTTAPELKKYDGQDYLVLPAVILTEGVHKGNLHTKEELSRSAPGWNGRPVIAGTDHPKNNEGNYISANAPEILQEMGIGMLMNTIYKPEGKLVSEVWINIEKCNKVNKQLLDGLRRAEKMELSTGLFVDTNDERGEWNTEEYASIVHNILPDHLILLIDNEGACNWADGCGIPRVNSKGESMKENVIDLGKKLAGLMGIKTADLKVEKEDENRINIISNQEKDNNKEGENSMNRKEKIESLINCETCPWIEEDKETLEALSEDAFDRIFDASEKSKEKFDALSKELKEVKEEKEEKQPSLDETLKADEADEDTDAIKAAKEAYKNSIEGNTEEEEEEQKPVTVEAYVKQAPAEIQEVLSSGIEMHRKRKVEIIKSLEANKRNEFAKEDLEGKSILELEKLQKLADKENDYSGKVTGNAKEDTEDEIPEPPVMKWDK